MQATNSIIPSLRIPFVVISPLCAFLGISIAIWNGAEADWLRIALIMVAAIAAHISVNTLNEYWDYRTGVDLNTRKTPFSGGSGLLPEQPQLAGKVLAVGVITLLLTIAIGLYFIQQYGLALLPLGLLGVLIVGAYSPWANRNPIVCLLVPGLGVGVLITMGAQFVLSGEYQTTAWVTALIPFFILNNLLLLNQYPDIEADAKSGRRTFPIVYGTGLSSFIYALFALMAVLVLLVAVMMTWLPVSALLALLPMPLAFVALRGAFYYGPHIGLHAQYLAFNVIVSLASPLLLGLGFLLA